MNDIIVFCPRCGESVRASLGAFTVKAPAGSTYLEVQIFPLTPTHECSNPQDAP